MNILSIKSPKTTTTKYDDKVPTKTTTPKSMHTNPKYMGFRLIRKTPFVIKIVDFSNGLTVVLQSLNFLSANRLMVIPNNKGIKPIKFHGKNNIFLTGINMCKKIIKAIDTNK
jgi:hypothetical protein